MSTSATATYSVLDIEPFVDWRDDHRDLGDGQREIVVRYVLAIVDRDRLVASVPALAEAEAAALWRRFREAYDSLRGLYGHSDAEDFARALRML